MSAQRLSKLQKWILTGAKNEGGEISRRKIYLGFWGEEKVYGNCLKHHKYHPPHLRGRCIDNKFCVSLTRSLRGLGQKGLIRYCRYFGGTIHLVPAMEINNKERARHE